VVIEAKASKRLSQADSAQRLNCLRCSSMEVGLLLHFGRIQESKGLAYRDHSPTAAMRCPRCLRQARSARLYCLRSTSDSRFTREHERFKEGRRCISGYAPSLRATAAISLTARSADSSAPSIQPGVDEACSPAKWIRPSTDAMFGSSELISPGLNHA
jgi:hypothetical protein